MSVYRKWYCTCVGSPVELDYQEKIDEEGDTQPSCRRCGATPSSDPRKTVIYRDIEDWED
ncbi:MAG: hypothetical protein C0617_04480 [Desulfuromonas sp.]|uniref:hypothetical protein n=1 Tax=Desulfuromonas sp. TaxID=892 RepID=UPI000CC92EB1|nr:hypothetical protein [Desulfuromonas sp.]PLX85334.1 MAG: hypothetical protein C0617_04480 [Desulfuromonas sp.]